MGLKDIISQKIEAKRQLLISTNDSIWEFAETRFEEYKSSELISKILEEEGFKVIKGIADMETAFIASYGSGKPVIGLLGEYDALYGLSQLAGSVEKKPLIEGGNGHGCGHQALGTGSLAAVIAVKEYMEENNIKGTIRYYGCPGEEGGSGKVYMVRASCFKDADAVFGWHPGNENSVWTHNFLATIQICFKFHGISAHAGGSAYLGRSALDAVELMNVGANYLREHVIPEARFHYSITDPGGTSPNVVQPNASVLYQIRAPKMSQTREIYERITNIAKGAALMTGTTVEVVFDRASSNMLSNRTLNKYLYEKLVEMDAIRVDEKDVKFAAEIINTLSESEKSSTKQNLEAMYGEKIKEYLRLIADKEIVDIIFPYIPTNAVANGSTDVGDVSWNVPTALIWATCFANGTPGHSWQQVAQGKSELCHKGMLHAGKAMALAVADIFEKPELLKQARKEFEEKISQEPYVCPIPSDVKPTARR
jgi:aminobenzoyl-glutamate utilization protein B